ncbi:uncharacterized protein LOC125590436 [Brassica napus]|uniref:uncharacterized protein LOC125590436 n=1 Tax=Brassica napus TaxID=3708 RepID=UPI00207922EE|nr:uncharacterized protein LOC125590436 [Brassica napus]
MVVDVIGQPTDFGDLEVVQVLGKDKKKLEFTLTDTRFAKINVYKGQVQVTNAFETSSLVINPDGFDVQDYLRMAPNNELALSDGIREVVKPKGNKRQIEKWSTYPERSVLDIIMATECNFKKVTDITNRDVVPVKHLWRCETCNQSITNVAPQFKLHLLIKDDYGETKVMLLDTIAEPILGVSADVLLGGSLEEVEDPEDLPDAITDLIGKTFKFGVYVNKDNVDYEADIFNIGKIWAVNEIISEDDDTVTNVVSSDRSSGQISLISTDEEDNPCLSSTPVSKRRGDNDIDDLSSTSKKQCSKVIKVEKNIWN